MMSRIVGLSDPRTAPEQVCVEHNLQLMLDRALFGYSTHTVSWQRETVRCRTVALGWTGGSTGGSADDDGVILVVDGAIYNRNDWSVTDSDAALLAELYRRHGFVGMLQRLNGDFAIALYDRNRDELWLGRDRLGIRPLYYWHQGDRFAFASRPRSLLALPEVSPEVNRRFVALFAASHYRTFDNDPHASPYAEICQLPAAHALCYRLGQVHLERYWELQDLPDCKEPSTVLATRYRDLLMDAVARRLAVAERPAFTLSGGMDSSSVLSCAVRTAGARHHAFSTVYRDKTYDESEQIRSMLETCVEQWHPVEIDRPDVFSLVEQMIAVHDEPVATATWLSHFLLCGEVQQQGFGSLFGGLGGDELNAGEYEYFPFYFADLDAAGEQERLEQELLKWSEYHDHPVFRKSPEIGRAAIARLTDRRVPGRCLPDRDRLQKYLAALNPEYFDLKGFEPVMDAPFGSYLKNRTYQDLFRETAPCCLRAEDRQAVAWGLEHFLPFLDHRLVEFMYRVPGHLKISDGITKRLLREAMDGLLPAETRLRVKKTGWNAPAHIWFSGANAERLLDWVRSADFCDRGIYEPLVVEQLIVEHQEAIASGDPSFNHMMFLWQLVNLQIWLS